jgi:Chromo (CHRromatin Organisation MOdifier) domain
MSFDWQAASSPKKLDMQRRDAQEWVKRMEQIWKYAREGIELAQAKQKQQADKHRRDEEFQVGDYAMVSTKRWNTGRPSRKSDAQASGLYKILARIGHSYKLDLPSHIKIHPVFLPDKLRRATSLPPLQGQIRDPEPPIEINGEKEWEVERILAVRLFRKKRLQYRVKWIGYDEDSQWYPAGNFKNSPFALRDFHQYPDQPGPPRRLDEWIEAAGREEFVANHEGDDEMNA